MGRFGALVDGTHSTAIGDPDVEAVRQAELARQTSTLQLIASENFTSPAVMAVMGSELINGFAEGTAGNGTYRDDSPQAIACHRARLLFGAEHANVEPHASSVANFAVLMALARPGDTVMGMGMRYGGHVSHGQPVNITGQMCRSVRYGVNPDTGLLDFDEIAGLARRARPKVIFCGSTSYPRIIDVESFRRIAADCGAKLVFDAAYVGGLIAAGLHPNPTGIVDAVTLCTHKTLRGPRGGAILCKEEHGAAIDRAVSPGIQSAPLVSVVAAKAVAFAEASTPDFRAYAEMVVDNGRALAAALLERGFSIVTGGTDTHIVVVDLRSLHVDLSGLQAEAALDAAGISASACAAPGDPRLPRDTSAICLGTAALTSAGMRTEHMSGVAELILRALRNHQDLHEAARVRSDVAELCAAFPPYGEAS
jgi:glycine hydroxymethyltransferase